MSCLALEAEYRECRSSLKQISLDDNKPNVKHYMTESNLSAYSFDLIKNKYSNKFDLSNYPKSVDALSPSIDGDIYLIEFKNGNLSDNRKGKEIRQKIYDRRLKN